MLFKVKIKDSITFPSLYDFETEALMLYSSDLGGVTIHPTYKSFKKMQQIFKDRIENILNINHIKSTYHCFSNSSFVFIFTYNNISYCISCETDKSTLLFYLSEFESDIKLYLDPEDAKLQKIILSFIGYKTEV